MNENERIDLSALDPDRDPQHWQRVLAETMARVDGVLAQGEDPFATIAGWRRPLLIAAAAAIAVLVPVELALEVKEREAEQVQRLVSLATEWEHGEGPPSTAAFLRALAAGDRP
ncbi:MAG: hypothetical protein KFH98_06620 [Gemmatimonadetes bacterium]|nr:hypothetical protein [Gemmatimonadota bacterium]